MCIHCGEYPAHEHGVLCKRCVQRGRGRMREVARTPWWTHAPYRDMEFDVYLKALILGLEDSLNRDSATPDLQPSSVGRPPRVDFPNRDLGGDP